MGTGRGSLRAPRFYELQSSELDFENRPLESASEVVSSVPRRRGAGARGVGLVYCTHNMVRHMYQYQVPKVPLHCVPEGRKVGGWQDFFAERGYDEDDDPYRSAQCCVANCDPCWTE